MVDLLFRCYLRLGIAAEFPTVIERIQSIVADSRWEDKIHFFRALWNLIAQGNEAGAREELSFVDIPKCSDSELLGVYWSIHASDSDFQTSVDLLDRIIENSDESSNRLHYTIAKGVKFLMICDVARGCEIIESAIFVYQSADAHRHKVWGDLQHACGLEILAQFKSDMSLVEEAASKYRDLIAYADVGGFASDHVSELKRSLADCLSLLGDHENAAINYEESLSLLESPLTQLFYARAQIRAGNLDQGRDRLMALDSTGFDKSNMFDHALIWSSLAATSLESNDLATAKVQLKSNPSDDPYFERYRQQWLVTLLETTPRKPSSRLATLLLRINQYVALKPNLFGIGLDLNKVFADIGSERSEHDSNDSRSPESTKQ